MSQPQEPLAAIGRPVDRVDGRLKVTGGAPLRGRVSGVAGVTYAVLVMSTVAERAHPRRSTRRRPRRAPGVLAVITHRNAPRLNFPERRVGMDPRQVDDHLAPVVGRTLPVLQDDTHLLQRAAGRGGRRRNPGAGGICRDAGTRRLRRAKPVTSVEAEMARAFPPQEGLGPNLHGEAGRRRARRPGRLEEGRGGRRRDLHHPDRAPQPDGTARHDCRVVGGRLTLHDKTQWVPNVQGHVALVFGIPGEDVRVIGPFIGRRLRSRACAPGRTRSWRRWRRAWCGGRSSWCCTRRQMFSSHGHRPYTVQRVALGATRDGRLTAIVHEGTAQTSLYEENTENLVNASRMLYASPNCITRYRLVRGNVQTPLYMRGPGEISGVFALDSALDELADRLKMDPLEYSHPQPRRRGPGDGLPWSSKSLLECYRRGAEAFGWSRRTLEPRSMRDGRTSSAWEWRREPTQRFAPRRARGRASLLTARRWSNPLRATWGRGRGRR